MRDGAILILKTGEALPPVKHRYGDFEDWIARMHTPPDRVAALRKLADATDPEVRNHFRFTARPGTFRIPIALLRG